MKYVINWDYGKGYWVFKDDGTPVKYCENLLYGTDKSEEGDFHAKQAAIIFVKEVESEG